MTTTQATMEDVFKGYAWLDADGECVSIDEDDEECPDGHALPEFVVVVFPKPEMPDSAKVFHSDDKQAVIAFLLGRYNTLTPKWNDR